MASSSLGTLYWFARKMVVFLYAIGEKLRKVRVISVAPSPLCFISFKYKNISGIIPFESMADLQSYLERNNQTDFQTRVFKYIQSRGEQHYVLKDLDHDYCDPKYAPNSNVGNIISADLLMTDHSPTDVYNLIVSSFHENTLITNIPYELVVYLLNKSPERLNDDKQTMCTRNVLIIKTTELVTVEIY